MSPLKRRMKPPRRMVRKVKKKNRQFEVVTRRLGRWTKLSPTGDRAGRVRVYVDRHAHVHFSLSDALQAEREDLRCGAEIFDFHRLSDDPATLGYWGVPAEICERYRKQHQIERLFPWQSECLAKLEKIPGFNIYTVPTSAGKSLVAEILILQRLLYEGKRALYVAPFVSICAEKVAAFRKAWGSAVVVAEVHGGSSGDSSYFSSDVDVAVCTVEKAHGILNRWLQETKVEISSQFRSPPVGTIVIDEFHHVLTDGSRGHLIEGLLVKLKLLNRKLGDENFRVVGLSATMPEIQRLGHWLNAEIYSGNFRPVELKISAHIDNYKFLIPLISSGPVSSPPSPPDHSPNATRQEVPLKSVDFIVHACAEISGGVLVFCPSKAWCETTATSLAQNLPPSPPESSGATSAGRAALVAALQQLEGGSPQSLLQCILTAGVVWHHAGLTTQQRALIETGYRERHIRVICCTSTLAAGVNLGGSTQRVIIRSLASLAKPGGPQARPEVAAMQQRERLLQMAGRAGRTGSAAKFGECFVCLDSKTQINLLRSLLDPSTTNTATNHPQTTSTSGGNLGHMNARDKRHYSKLVLECVGTGLIRREPEIQEDQDKALLAPVQSAAAELRQLVDERYLKVTADGELLLTSLGEAVAFSLMSMAEAEEVLNELKMKLRNLKLDHDDFELVYLCVSQSQLSHISAELDERNFLPFIEMEGLMTSYMTAKSKRRWLAAFALRRLLTSNGIGRVHKELGIQVAHLQQLLSNAATYCGTLVMFCERRKWHSLSAALSTLTPRLQYGLPAEILPLTKMPSVFAARARALFAAGLTDAETIAKAEVREVAAAISKCTAVEHGDLQKYDENLKKVGERIIKEAKLILNRAANAV